MKVMAAFQSRILSLDFKNIIIIIYIISLTDYGGFLKVLISLTSLLVKPIFLVSKQLYSYLSISF